MEVKAGYKQTEIGVVPKAWDVKRINTIAKIIGGGTPSTLIDEYWNGKIPWVSAGDISNAKGRYVKGTEFSISELGLSNSPTKILPKDTTIIIARGATVGRMAQFGKDMAFNQTCYCLLPNNGLDKNYLYYSMLFSVNSIIAMSYGTIFGTITTNSFRDWCIPLPPLPEQEAIAEALSDADVLIETLEQLLAKKRQVKQGAMQELFTGKRRLPGFSEKWEDKRLGELSEMGSGGTPLTSNPNFYDGDIPWVSITDMTNGGKSISSTERNLTTAGLNNSSAQMFPAGTVLYAMYASLGECSIAEIPLCTSQAILGIRVKPSLHNEFLYYFLTYIKPQVKTMGQHGTQTNLNKGMVQDFRLSLPSFPEQTAIAEILRDMDAEITALEGKLSKARQVKTGMMSVLLTGRVRLVDDTKP